MDLQDWLRALAWSVVVISIGLLVTLVVELYTSWWGDE